MKNSRQKSAGSLKKSIPIITVPTAPIPVQTAYAVPMGNVWVARYSKYILIERQIKKPVIQAAEVVPDVSLALPRQVVKPTSNSPAIIKMIQFIRII